MNPMNEAWKLLKANPEQQADMQGTNRLGTGGTIPQQFVQQPGATYNAGDTHPSSRDMRTYGQYGYRAGRPERQQHPSVGDERSFQSLGHTGQEESAISRPPKQRFMDRRRDAKQQRLAQRAEQTGAGADYRQAFPMDKNPQSVFEPSASTMRRVQRLGE